MSQDPDNLLHEDKTLESDEPPAIHLCIDCAKDTALKQLVAQLGTIGATCSICQQAVSVTTKAEDIKDLATMFRALIRYHYDEWDYNDHLGGDSPEALLTAQNPILASERAAPDADLDVFFEAIFWPPYPPYNEGIAIYAGYDDNMQLPPLHALSRSMSATLVDAAKELRHKNFFEVESTIEEQLGQLLGTIDTTVPAGEIYFRARIGTAGRYFDIRDFNPRILYKPYLGAEIGAPPPAQAAAGRANRQGVSFLYVATSPETATSEVRPHPGHHVSIGAYKATKPLRIADFGHIDLGDFAKSDTLLDLYHLGSGPINFLAKGPLD